MRRLGGRHISSVLEPSLRSRVVSRMVPVKSQVSWSTMPNTRRTHRG